MEAPLSFFGYELEPQKPYTHTPPEGAILKLSNAALGSSAAEGERVTLSCKVEGKEFVIANFIGGKVEHAHFDLNFADNHEVIFIVKGDAPVHITGYYTLVDEEDFDDLEGMYSDLDDDEEEEEEESPEKPKQAPKQIQAPKQVQNKQAPKQLKIEELPEESDESDLEDEGDSEEEVKVGQKRPQAQAAPVKVQKTETGKQKVPQQKKPEQKAPQQQQKKPEQKGQQQQKGQPQKGQPQKGQQKKK